MKYVVRTKGIINFMRYQYRNDTFETLEEAKEYDTFVNNCLEKLSFRIREKFVIFGKYSWNWKNPWTYCENYGIFNEKGRRLTVK